MRGAGWWMWLFHLFEVFLLSQLLSPAPYLSNRGVSVLSSDSAGKSNGSFNNLMSHIIK